MRIDHRVAAIDAFVESVKKQPYNWSAWSQLAQMIKSTEMVRMTRPTPRNASSHITSTYSPLTKVVCRSPE